jgi:hypothetical protein
MERRHLNQIARTNFRASPAAGAFLIINDSKVINYVKGIKLAGLLAVAEPQASELAGLRIR